MVGNPDLWLASDAATDLFFPLWSLRDGRYLAALLGLLGWISLILVLAPWRSQSVAHVLPWIVPEKGSLLGFLIEISPAYLGMGLLFGSNPHHRGRGPGRFPRSD